MMSTYNLTMANPAMAPGWAMAGFAPRGSATADSKNGVLFGQLLRKNHFEHQWRAQGGQKGQVPHRRRYPSSKWYKIDQKMRL